MRSPTNPSEPGPRRSFKMAIATLGSARRTHAVQPERSIRWVTTTTQARSASTATWRTTEWSNSQGATTMNSGTALPAGTLTAKLTSAGQPPSNAHKREKGQPASQSPPRRRWTRSRSAADGDLSLIRVMAAPKSSMSNFNSPGKRRWWTRWTHRALEVETDRRSSRAQRGWCHHSRHPVDGGVAGCCQRTYRISRIALRVAAFSLVVAMVTLLVTSMGPDSVATQLATWLKHLWRWLASIASKPRAV